MSDTQSPRIISTTLAHPEIIEASASIVFAHVPREFTLKEALYELDFATDVNTSEYLRNSPDLIPSRIGSWIEAYSLSATDNFSRAAFGGPDIANYFETLLREPCVIVEHSPPDLASITHLLKQGGGVAVGAYAGFQVATGPLLLITVPLGIIIVGVASGIGSALEAGLRERILKFILGSKKKTPSGSRSSSQGREKPQDRGMAAG